MSRVPEIWVLGLPVGETRSRLRAHLHDEISGYYRAWRFFSSANLPMEIWGNSDHVVNGANPSAGVVWSPT